MLAVPVLVSWGSGSVLFSVGVLLGSSFWSLFCGSCACFVRVRLRFVLCWGLVLKATVVWSLFVLV